MSTPVISQDNLSLYLDHVVAFAHNDQEVLDTALDGFHLSYFPAGVSSAYLKYVCHLNNTAEVQFDYAPHHKVCESYSLKTPHLNFSVDFVQEVLTLISRVNGKQTNYSRALTEEKYDDLVKAYLRFAQLPRLCQQIDRVGSPVSL